MKKRNYRRGGGRRERERLERNMARGRERQDREKKINREKERVHAAMEKSQHFSSSPAHVRGETERRIERERGRK